jgi:hypothetical protein
MILQSFTSLFTDSSHIKFVLPLPLFPLLVRLLCYKLVPPGASVGYVQTISNVVAQSSPQLVSPLISRVCHRFGYDLFLCGHKSIVIIIDLLFLTLISIFHDRLLPLFQYSKLVMELSGGSRHLHHRQAPLVNQSARVSSLTS